MKIDGIINQINSDVDRGTYINLENAGHGGIMAWCNFKIVPTYFCEKGSFVYIIQFESQDWADEWLEEFEKNYDLIKRLM